MLVIGLTGPMGAGKSVVLGMLREHGAEVLRADDASRELLCCDQRLLSEIRNSLGEGLFRADGSLDRGQTAALIFADAQARRRLEAILHPPMVQWLRQQVARWRQAPAPPAVVVIEAAILRHMGAAGLVEGIVRVAAPRELCLARLQARDGISAAEAADRLAIQEAMGLFVEPADCVLDTTGSLDDTRRRVDRLWDELLARSAAGRGE